VLSLGLSWTMTALLGAWAQQTSQLPSGRALHIPDHAAPQTDSGHAAEARLRLEELVSRVPESVQPYAVATALAVLSLIAGDQDDRAAASLAR
jgi:hypothetical protein